MWNENDRVGHSKLSCTIEKIKFLIKDQQIILKRAGANWRHQITQQNEPDKHEKTLSSFLLISCFSSLSSNNW